MAKVVTISSEPEHFLGTIGVRFLLDGTDSHSHFSIVEHTLPPYSLAAPLHRHTREDEYSIVLEGQVGALLGDEVVYGKAGDIIRKPRDQWHTFWNAGSEPARLLEIISPSGFDNFFVELSRLGASGAPVTPDVVLGLGDQYGVTPDFSSVPELLTRFGLVFGLFPTPLAALAQD